MVADGAEHWTIDLPVRTEYLLSVDGDRSTWQPHGVHGVSEYIGSDRDRPGEKPTVARPRCNGSWTPRMARGWRSAWTWSTTTGPAGKIIACSTIFVRLPKNYSFI